MLCYRSFLQIFKDWYSPNTHFPAYGVYFSQLICFAARASSLYSDFLRHRIPSTNLLNHGLLRIISSFKKFFGRYQHLVEKYSVSCIQMTKYVLTIRFWFKVDCSTMFTITLYIIQYLDNGWCHRLFNRTNIMHISTSVRRGLNILCIMFKIIAFFRITLFARLYVRVGILLTFGKHLHDRTISLRGDIQIV